MSVRYIVFAFILYSLLDETLTQLTSTPKAHEMIRFFTDLSSIGCPFTTCLLTTVDYTGASSLVSALGLLKLSMQLGLRLSRVVSILSKLSCVFRAILMTFFFFWYQITMKFVALLPKF